ncbi:MAG: cytochrome d ubiquinol oxidase subunit II [Rhodospirillales bacterium]|nr:cytochrome d ubiquinol oxidase subunit II [Rhodospirillales bacterium]
MAIAWAGLIAFSILVYVLLDGFDLGVGILFGTTRDEAFRSKMMSAIAPVWDGNETWLVLVGASLFGAFPMVYAIFLPAFYLPVALLLFGLIFRGVAFEFRYRTHKMRWVWDWGFFLGSAIAAFVQGAAIGAMVQGLLVVDGRYAGGSFDWVSGFSILCGVGLVIGYALLGAAWLVLKTSGPLRSWAYRRVAWLLTGVLLFLALAFFFALVTELSVMNRWVESPWLLAFPVVGAIATIALYNTCRTRRSDNLPYLLSATLFIAAYLTLAGSFWPYMIPFSVTIADAAAPPQSLSFMFYGAGLFVFPVVLVYTAVSYWIFRGKVQDHADYS